MAALFPCFSEAQVKRQLFLFFMPPSLSSLALALRLSETGRLLWRPERKATVAFIKVEGRRRRRTRKTKHSPNKEIEQEKREERMCMKATFFSPFLYKVPPATPPHPCSFRLVQTKEARLSQCALSFSPAHFISSRHSLLLLESTHVRTTYVCVRLRVCMSACKECVLWSL